MRFPSRRARSALVAGLGALAMITTLATPASAASQTAAVAHRGDKQHHPDNSWSGITSAVQKGADWVEIDVQLNLQSGRVLLSHDPSCRGWDGWSYQIEKSSLSVIQQMCGLPDLEDMLRYYDQQYGYRRFIIEVKPTGSNAGRISYAVKNLVHRVGMQNDVWASSLDVDPLHEIQGTGSSIKLMKVRPYGITNVTRGYMDDIAARGFDAINVNIGSVGDTTVGYAHSKGLLFSTWAWTTADEGDNTRALQLGVDFHMTDRLDDMLAKKRSWGGGGGGGGGGYYAQ